MSEKPYISFKHGDYSEYLNAQKTHKNTKKRTVNRKNRRLHDIKSIKDNLSNAKSVLCIGCRDISEINDFKEEGFNKVIGIDLFSNNEEIKIIDMHDIESNFEENEFDIVYMSHSLEHSIDPEKVLKGIEKISKFGIFVVLPFMDKPTTKDTTVFNCMKSDNCINESIKETFSKLIGSNFEIVGPFKREVIKGDIGKDFSFLILFKND